MTVDRGREFSDSEKDEHDAVGLLMATLDRCSAMAERYDWPEWPLTAHPSDVMNDARHAISGLYQTLIKTREQVFSLERQQD